MEEINRTPFGQRLYDSREAARLTQEIAAKKAGMAQSTLAEAEISGKRSGYTPQLAELYGVSAKWLATGKLPMYVSATEGEPTRAAPLLPPTVAVIKPATERDKAIERLLDLATQLDLARIGQLTERAAMLLAEMPAKQTPESTG